MRWGSRTQQCDGVPMGTRTLTAENNKTILPQMNADEREIRKKVRPRMNANMGTNGKNGIFTTEMLGIAVIARDRRNRA